MDSRQTLGMYNTGIPGGMMMGQEGENPNSMMIRETMSQANHAEFNIQRERELEKLQQQLLNEFSVLDINGDGMVTLDEVVHFL